MNTETSVKAQVSRRFEAPPERVFDAFLNPEQAGRFMFATPTGEMVRAETDPCIGGQYAFVDRRDGQDVTHTGEYLEIDRPRRLVFTLKVTPFSEDSNRVAIDIVPQGGGCTLTLTHEFGPEFAEYKERTEQGWTGILNKLAEILG